MLRMTAALLILLPITQALAEEVDLSEIVEVEIVNIEGFTVIGLDIHTTGMPTGLLARQIVASNSTSII